MKIQVTQSVLAENLKNVKSGISTRSSLEILSFVHLVAGPKELLIHTTNLEMSFQITETRCSILEPGECTIRFSILQQILATVHKTETVTLETTSEDTVMLTTSDMEMNIQAMDPKDYPAPMVLNYAEHIIETLQVRANAFKEAVNLAIRSAADDDSRPVLTGILFEQEGNRMNCYGADAFRLTQSFMPIYGEGAFTWKPLVPAYTLKESLKLLPESGMIQISQALLPPEKVIKDSQPILFFHIKFGTIHPIEIFHRIIEGTYPSVIQVLKSAEKDNTTHVVCDRAKLLNIVKGAIPYAKDSSNITKYEISSVVTVRSSYEKYDYKRHVPAIKKEGADTESILNVTYVKDVLENIKDQQVIMEFSSPMRPAVIRPLDRSCAHVLMPMSTNR